MIRLIELGWIALAAAMAPGPALCADQIHEAAKRGDLAEVRSLVDRDPALVAAKDKGGETPLHWAAFSGNLELVRFLLANGAAVDAKNARGLTPLAFTAVQGRIQAAGLLIERGADVNSRDGDRRTPLHRVLGSSNPHVAEIALYFIDSGADVDTTDDEGETPLMTAVCEGYTEVVRSLLEKGARTDVRDRNFNQTLLHLAAIRGYRDIAEILLSRGLDANARDVSGATPIRHALLHGNAAVAGSLERALDRPHLLKLKDFGANVVAGKTGRGQATIWRLKTRGWAIKTGNHLFVIDQEESGRKPDLPILANGHVSADELAGSDVFALYTCYHAEPGTLEFIHGLEDSIDHIAYIHRKADRYRGGKNSIYMDGQEKKVLGNVEILAAEVDDSAFSLDYLVRADGLTIFYAGFYPEDIEAFKKEIDFLAGSGEGCDIAFVHTTDGDDHPYAAYIMEKLRPKAVLPMDPDYRVMDYKKMAEWLKEKYPGVQTGCVENPGDAHIYDRGKSSLHRAFYFSPRMGALLRVSRSRKGR